MTQYCTGQIRTCHWYNLSAGHKTESGISFCFKSLILWSTLFASTYNFTITVIKIASTVFWIQALYYNCEYHNTMIESLLYFESLPETSDSLHSKRANVEMKWNFGKNHISYLSESLKGMICNSNWVLKRHVEGHYIRRSQSFGACQKGLIMFITFCYNKRVTTMPYILLDLQTPKCMHKDPCPPVRQ